MTDKPLTGRERVGRIVAGSLGLASIVAAAANLALAFTGPQGLADFFKPPLLAGGSAVCLALLGVCAWLAAKDTRRHAEMFTLFILGNGVSLVAVSVTLLGVIRLGTTSLTPNGVPLSTRDILLSAWLVDAAVVTGCIVLKIMMNRALLEHLRFFSPAQFRALEAAAETLIDEGKHGASQKVPPYQIALRTDGYLGSFQSTRLRMAKAAVLALSCAPLCWLQPPLNYLNPAARRDFIDDRFKRDILRPPLVYRIFDRLFRRFNMLLILIADRSFKRLEAALGFFDLLEGIIRFNLQLTYIGYYGDPRVWPKAAGGIGYVPFSKRHPGIVVPKRDYPPLQVMTPSDVARRRIDVIPGDDIRTADVVVIGSGAAGAILAEQLAEKGREVLVLEKGAYVSPDEFSEDEVEMISRLYGDGALQISQSLRFTILQGSCVGGTTVVNNAVCFPTPDHVLNDTWNGKFKAGIDPADFCDSQKRVIQRMRIGSVAASSGEQALNPGDRVIKRGVESYFAKRQNARYEYDAVSANIVECLGCGYCNIGCKFGRKLSMLDIVLPSAQSNHPGKFHILSEAEAVRLNGSNGKVSEIVVQIQGKRTLRIRSPKTVIVSAGTIASSWLLRQSGIGAGELPVGRGICFNMGSPLHGYFEEDLHSFAGLQIAHYLKLEGCQHFVYETWYNPPVGQALAMPGWLDTHFTNMSRYDQIAAVGVLVGTDPDPGAYLDRALFLRNTPDVVYEPTRRDLNTLVQALKILGEIMLEGGAKEVMASTRQYRSYGPSAHHAAGRKACFRSLSDLDDLDALVKTDRDILLGTGHPQGGNRISRERGKNGKTGGVIRPDFKVHGYDNLYVCDASVFPSATTVNPQLSVMSMAHYAARMIA